MTEADPTVFVVDDDPSVRRSTERLVRSVGFNVQTFATAKEFTERARVESPSCLVLDVHLPGPSGLDLQRELVQAGMTGSRSSVSSPHATSTFHPGRARGRAREDAQPIAVEGHRLPVLLEVTARGAEVVERRLDLGEGELHEPARRVVDVDEQGAHGPAVFEPGVLRAVDLDELAETRAPRAGWVAAPRPLRPRHPERGRDHPAPQRLHGERDAVVSVSFWCANVGPKSAYRWRTSGTARSRVAVASRRLLGRFSRRDANPATPLRLEVGYRSAELAATKGSVL